MTREAFRAHTPGSVGCCTIGLDGLDSVLVVVVDAAPSSRFKAMIHTIMVAPPAWHCRFPTAQEASAQIKIRPPGRPSSPDWAERWRRPSRNGEV